MQICTLPVDLRCFTHHSVSVAPHRRASLVQKCASRQQFNVSSHRRSSYRCSIRAEAAGTAQSTAQAQPVMKKGELTEFPAAAGVYAVYSPDGRLQYIGLSRKVLFAHPKCWLSTHCYNFASLDSSKQPHEQASLDAGLFFQPKWKRRFLCVMQIAVSVASHIQELGGLTHSVRYEVVESASREDLTAKWQEWVQAAGDLILPPGERSCCPAYPGNELDVPSTSTFLVFMHPTTGDSRSCLKHATGLSMN